MSRLNCSSNWSTKVEVARARKTAGVPFVPAGDHDQRRIELVGPLPLFLEIGPAVQGRAGRIELAVVETAAAGVAVAHVRHPPVAGPQVLGHRDIDLLGLLRVVGVSIGLRVGRFPMPGIGRVDHLERPMGLAEREELLQLRAGLLGIADHQRLALPAEPQIRVEARLVEIVVNLSAVSPALVLTMKAICGVRPPSLRTAVKTSQSFM